MFSFGTALTDKSLDSKARQTKNQNELNKIGGLPHVLLEPPRSLRMSSYQSRKDIR